MSDDLHWMDPFDHYDSLSRSLKAMPPSAPNGCPILAQRIDVMQQDITTPEPDVHPHHLIGVVACGFAMWLRHHQSVCEACRAVGEDPRMRTLLQVRATRASLLSRDFAES